MHTQLFLVSIKVVQELFIYQYHIVRQLFYGSFEN